jgi:hypothetical protein
MFLLTELLILSVIASLLVPLYLHIWGGKYLDSSQETDNNISATNSLDLNTTNVVSVVMQVKCKHIF